MERVTTKVTIENLEDVWALRRGKMNAEQVRRVDVPNALIDTGAVALSLTTRIIQELGLVAIGIKNTITATCVIVTKELHLSSPESQPQTVLKGRN